MLASTQAETASDRAVSVFRANGGILNTRRAMKLGVYPRTIYALRDSARLERMERGPYRRADAPAIENSDFITVTLKVPKGIICLISALAFHQMTAQVPDAIYLAIGRTTRVRLSVILQKSERWSSRARYRRAGCTSSCFPRGG